MSANPEKPGSDPRRRLALTQGAGLGDRIDGLCRLVVAGVVGAQGVGGVVAHGCSVPRTCDKVRPAVEGDYSVMAR